jgi:hypothetical protein
VEARESYGADPRRPNRSIAKACHWTEWELLIFEPVPEKKTHAKPGLRAATLLENQLEPRIRNLEPAQAGS